MFILINVTPLYWVLMNVFDLLSHHLRTADPFRIFSFPRSAWERNCTAEAEGYHAERGSQMYGESQLAKTAITTTNSYPPAAALHCPRSLWRWSNANVHPDQRNPALLGSDECIRSFVSSSQNC